MQDASANCLTFHKKVCFGKDLLNTESYVTHHLYQNFHSLLTRSVDAVTNLWNGKYWCSLLFMRIYSNTVVFKKARCKFMHLGRRNEENTVTEQAVVLGRNLSLKSISSSEAEFVIYSLPFTPVLTSLCCIPMDESVIPNMFWHTAAKNGKDVVGLEDLLSFGFVFGGFCGFDIFHARVNEILFCFH